MKSLVDAIRPTTLIRSTKLTDHLGMDITVASETFQHTGSFKFRAGCNVALNVPQDEVLAASSGNFGQALAYGCKLLGKKCTIVMPATSARVKIDAVRAFGATVDLIDVTKVARDERIRQLADSMPNAYVASAYDDKFVIEGNASLGAELIDQGFDAVITPIGGGGLISGLITAFQTNGADVEMYGAEPLLGNDAARSLRTGQLVRNETEPATIADGARTVSLGKLNWEIIRTAGVRDIVEVPDDKIADAMRLYFDLANLKCEPTGALPLAAVLTTPDVFRDKKLCLIATGANVDASVYAGIIQDRAAAA
jgi:threonine dehydratase